MERGTSETFGGKRWVFVFFSYLNLILYHADREEEKKKQEWREIAKKELEEWYRNHEEAIAKTKAANR